MGNLKDEVSESLGAAFMEDVLPKIKPFIPMLKNQLESKDDLISKDDFVLITKNSKDKFVIFRSSYTDWDILEKLKLKEIDRKKLEVYGLDGLLEKLLGV